jgi:Holliday junction resolvasome RuvABC endonuclease subunit
MIKFLAVDSSLTNTGIAWGEIDGDKINVKGISLNTTEKSKHKQVRASSDTIARCKQSYNFLQKMTEYVKPQVVFAETPTGSQGANSMKSYGATCQLIATLKPEAIEVTPNEVKMASVGSKTASKKDMIAWAAKACPNLSGWDKNKNGTFKNKNEHMADAVKDTGV